MTDQRTNLRDIRYLADIVPADDSLSVITRIKVSSHDLKTVVTGSYDQCNSRARTDFAQAAGKLLAAGYTVKTWREMA